MVKLSPGPGLAGAFLCDACRFRRVSESWQGHGRHSGVEDQSMTAYVLVIVLAAGHHQPFAVGYPDQGSCLVAAERLRRNKKTHVECLKFVQGK
jgi:hypothetical protein